MPLASFTGCKLRFFASLRLAYMDVGKEREQDAASFTIIPLIELIIGS